MGVCRDAKRKLIPLRGAIGAWIKNVEGPPEDAVDSQEEGLDLSKMDLTKLDVEGSGEGDETPT